MFFRDSPSAGYQFERSIVGIDYNSAACVLKYFAHTILLMLKNGAYLSQTSTITSSIEEQSMLSALIL